jgi:hypothetical protein
MRTTIESNWKMLKVLGCRPVLSERLQIVSETAADGNDRIHQMVLEDEILNMESEGESLADMQG